MCVMLVCTQFGTLLIQKFHESWFYKSWLFHKKECLMILFINIYNHQTFFKIRGFRICEIIRWAKKVPLIQLFSSILAITFQQQWHPRTIGKVINPIFKMDLLNQFWSMIQDAGNKFGDFSLTCSYMEIQYILDLTLPCNS